MAAFIRTFAPLIRTTRVTLLQQKGVNPVQQVFGRDAAQYRGLATVFERNKPHVNIGWYPCDHQRSSYNDFGQAQSAMWTTAKYATEDFPACAGSY